MDCNRREFLKNALNTGAVLALGMPLSSCSPVDIETSDTAFSLSTPFSIDEFVAKYCPEKAARSDISDACSDLLQKYKGNIISAGQYGCPPDLLAVALSIEEERGIERIIGDFIGSVRGVDYSAGVAQIMLGRGLGLLAGISQAKGYAYVRKQLIGFNKAEAAELGQVLREYYSNVSKREELRKSNEVRKLVEKALVGSPELSIEAASFYIGDLSRKLKSAHRISNNDFRTNPIAAYMVLNAYRGGEKELDKHRQARHHLDLNQFTLKKLAYIRTGSRINRMFSGYEYSMIPNRRQRN